MPGKPSPGPVDFLRSIYCSRATLLPRGPQPDLCGRAARVLGGAMRRPSVLVVDDDAFSRAVVSRKVAKFSDVVEAEDGLEALSRLQTIGVRSRHRRSRDAEFQRSRPHQVRARPPHAQAHSHPRPDRRREPQCARGCADGGSHLVPAQAPQLGHVRRAHQSRPAPGLPGRSPGAARHAHRPAQPRAAERAPGAGVGRHQGRRIGGHPHPRPRPFQARQRHARPHRRRQAPGHGRPTACALSCARRTRSRAWAATSSPSSSAPPRWRMQRRSPIASSRR